jgi:hypothetical protein
MQDSRGLTNAQEPGDDVSGYCLDKAFVCSIHQSAIAVLSKKTQWKDLAMFYQG